MNLVQNLPSRVGVIGLGYVGLPVALLAARSGYRVFGVDVDEKHIFALSNSKSKINEPGLPELLASMVDEKRIEFSTVPQTCDIFVVAVPTPITSERKADLAYVVSAVKSFCHLLQPGSLVIIESTVSPGCCRNVVLPILEASGLRCGEDFYLAYCPERVLPGKALQEIAENARIVGGFSPRCSAAAKNFYEAFVEGPILVSGIEQAELSKLAENAYRDVNIAFANELANVCEHLGVSHLEVTKLANAHPRVNILSAGPGVGGHCIAVDPWFLIEACSNTPLLSAARTVNDHRPKRVIQRVVREFRSKPAARIAVLGLSYKANVGDLRESPAMEIAVGLAEVGFEVIAVDPHVDACHSGAFKLHKGDVEGLVEFVDGVLLLVDHAEFQQLDWTSLFMKLDKKFFLDTRGVTPGRESDFAAEESVSPAARRLDGCLASVAR